MPPRRPGWFAEPFAQLVIGQVWRAVHRTRRIEQQGRWRGFASPAVAHQGVRHPDRPGQAADRACDGARAPLPALAQRRERSREPLARGFIEEWIASGRGRHAVRVQSEEVHLRPAAGTRLRQVGQVHGARRRDASRSLPINARKGAKVGETEPELGQRAREIGGRLFVSRKGLQPSPQSFQRVLFAGGLYGGSHERQPSERQ